MALGTAAAHCEARQLVAAEKLGGFSARPARTHRPQGRSKTGVPCGRGLQGMGKSGIPCGRGLQGMGKGLEGLEGVAEAVELEGLADLEHDLDAADEDIICLNALGLEALAADEGEGKLGAAAEHGTDSFGLC